MVGRTFSSLYLDRLALATQHETKTFRKVLTLSWHCLSGPAYSQIFAHFDQRDWSHSHPSMEEIVPSDDGVEETKDDVQDDLKKSNSHNPQ